MPLECPWCQSKFTQVETLALHLNMASLYECNSLDSLASGNGVCKSRVPTAKTRCRRDDGRVNAATRQRLGSISLADSTVSWETEKRLWLEMYKVLFPSEAKMATETRQVSLDNGGYCNISVSRGIPSPCK